MISNNKPRPANGPGSNGMRGGKKVYGGKTAIGGWLDDVGGPIGYNRGFSTTDYITEAQNQQMGVTLRQAPLYGAYLNTVGNEVPSVADNFKSKIDDHFRTTTSLMSDSLKNPVKESYVPASSLKGEELEKYRQTWTLDSAVAKSVRYSTESRRAANSAPEQFRVPSVRLLPGTPKPLELFRDRLLDKYGILGLSALRYYVGSGIISCSQFRSSIAQLDVKLSPAEFSQIVAYFTASDTFNADDLIRTLVARTDGFDRQQPMDIFYSLFGTDEVSLDDITSRVNEATHREAAMGFKMFLPGYAKQGGVLTVADFVALHLDFFSSAPMAYAEIVAGFWA